MPRSRSRVRSETERVIKNRVRLWLTFRHSEVSEPHRFHKMKPFDCGNTQCGLCRKRKTKARVRTFDYDLDN